jgi:pimeloyl-ACP methyl ester carboxylesterase
MPGYGDSPLSGPLSFASLAASLEQMLVAAHVKKEVLVGHSMGGMVALQAWTHCPQRIAGLVIAASSPAFGQQEGDFQQQFVAQRLAPLNAGKTMAQVANRLVPSMVAPNALPVDAALQDYPAGLALAHACMSAVPPDTYRASLQALVTFEQRAALPSIAVPTLCLAGEHDTTAPPEVLRRMAQKIPGAHYECIPGVGHLMGFEQEAPFHQAILNFVRTSY